jgi:hypothetical protein
MIANIDPPPGFGLQGDLKMLREAHTDEWQIDKNDLALSFTKIVMPIPRMPEKDNKVQFSLQADNFN